MGTKDCRVKELINVDTRTWKEDVLNACFHQRDVTKVLSVHLAHAAEKNRSWRFSRDEKYIVYKGTT